MTRLLYQIFCPKQKYAYTQTQTLPCMIIIIINFFLGHVTAMSDVFSFGVVLLELISGRRCLDKSLPNREQNLVDWAKPFLKDSHKVDRIMDPRLEGQYSAEGARKAATLAHQCLSQHPKSRPTMSTVVKTLEALLSLTDIPTPFVYVVPSCEGEGSEGRSSGGGRKEDVGGEGIISDQRRSRKGNYYRKKYRIRSLRSSAVYSDTALYRIRAINGLYSPKCAPKKIKQHGLIDLVK